MKQRSTPREKKELEYTKDHVDSSEYPHAFRKQWPRKKARSHRAYRRGIHQLLDTLSATPQVDFLDDRVDPEKVVQKKVKKWRVVSMGRVVRRRIDSRIERTAWNFFKDPYNSSLDRARFARFLASQVDGHTKQSRNLALLFKEVLYGSADVRSMGRLQFWRADGQRHQAWLRAFFQDEPEWEGRLRTWIASFEQE